MRNCIRVTALEVWGPLLWRFCIKGVTLTLALRTDEGISKRWALMRGSYVTKGVTLQGTLGPQGLAVSICFLARMWAAHRAMCSPAWHAVWPQTKAAGPTVTPPQLWAEICLSSSWVQCFRDSVMVTGNWQTPTVSVLCNVEWFEHNRGMLNVPGGLGHCWG